jgi:hypothetical protein
VIRAVAGSNPVVLPASLAEWLKAPDCRSGSADAVVRIHQLALSPWPSGIGRVIPNHEVAGSNPAGGAGHGRGRCCGRMAERLGTRLQCGTRRFEPGCGLGL